MANTGLAVCRMRVLLLIEIVMAVLVCFTDPYADVLQSINRLQHSPFVRHKDHIRGFVYDVADGRLHEVVPE